MNTKIYNKLNQIEQLKWFPWIGENYLSLPTKHRFLIVGESHYLDDKNVSTEKHEASKEKLNNSHYIKDRLIPEVINRDYKHWEGNHGNMYPNFHKALFKNDKFNAFAFYNLISFSTFLQKPLQNKNDRKIVTSDKRMAWSAFFKIVNTIHPSNCIFIGVEASNSLKKIAEEFDINLNDFKKHKKISNTYPRTAEIKIDNSSINIIFMQHSSHHFSWKKWNNFLHSQIGEQIDWMKDKIEL
jgi:hypothetical protein